MAHPKDLTHDYNSAVRALFPNATGCAHDTESTRVYFADGREQVVSHELLLAQLGSPASTLSESERKFMFGF